MAIALATATAVLVALCLLPSDRYIRFQTITDLAVVKAGWIYERIHYDLTPIDVVVIGTSHALFGVDSEQVERACEAAGGHACATVNFALQHLGRNLHWLVAREVLQMRNPKLLVVEVQETEYRAMHPAFGSLADVNDIVFAPLVINTSYLPDLGRLPLRQLSLFVEERFSALYHVQKRFVAANYRGSHWNDTYIEAGSLLHPVLHAVPRTRSISTQLLERERFYGNGEEKTHLPAALRQLEYRASLFYLEKLLTLAREKHIEVRFLYMPSYHVESSPMFAGLYAKFAPTWRMPSYLLERSELWNDVNHLNYAGAEALSAWLGSAIAREVPEASSLVPGPGSQILIDSQQR